jgi:hypothetical protein
MKITKAQAPDRHPLSKMAVLVPRAEAAKPPAIVPMGLRTNARR